MHDPPVGRVPPASRWDPKQGTLIGQSGQARRLPDRQQAYGSPAPTTMRAGYSEGSNTRLCRYKIRPVIVYGADVMDRMFPGEMNPSA